ncbi:uncharacterized protein LOC127783610 [Oryza glaberrima]|uniref:uncharacterized protein LOC127783610 n=1 Tax=Oryza glaberrima TaxID=4538 RepID=UPI00224C38F2|nr:uncharacterized protein LOC127783610 [Oryza glaberrima]
MLRIYPFNFILYRAADRRERRRAYGTPERAPSATAADIVVVPTTVDQTKPSRRANIFSLKSSSKTLKNPRQWRRKCGDQLPSSSPPVAIAIVDSGSSVDRAVAVFPELYTVAGPSSSPLPLSRLSRASFKMIA